MDQLTACQILEIEPDSSREEIMEAYARMVKRYHPEDNPTEFAQIQEAYRVLMKGKRRKHRQEQKTAAEYTAGTGTYMDEHEAAGAYTDQHVNAGTDADEHVDAGAYTDEHMNAGTDADEHEDAGAYTDKHEAAGTDADEYEAAAALFEKRFQEFDYRDELRMEEERRYREEEIARREAAFLEKQREEEEQERREREQSSGLPSIWKIFFGIRP